MFMHLVLVRHGATVNNAEQRFTGQADVPLSPLGLQQARAVAEALAGERFDLIVSSDLARARETAAAIARHHAVAPRLDADLREIAMGTWEGRTYAEVAGDDSEGFARWRLSPELAPPPGGEDLLRVRDRTGGAIARYAAEYPTGRVLCVTHGGVIGMLLCHLLTLDLAQRWRFRRDNAAITELDIGPDYAILLRLNDTCHLRGLPSGEALQVL